MTEPLLECAEKYQERIGVYANARNMADFARIVAEQAANHCWSREHDGNSDLDEECLADIAERVTVVLEQKQLVR